MLDGGRRGCGGLSVEHGRSFDVSGFHRSDRGRRWGSSFFDYGFFDHGFFDCGFGSRFVDGEFRDGLDGGDFFHGRRGLGSGCDFNSKRV